jgi:uncharacterized protein (TIGR03083 family)
LAGSDARAGIDHLALLEAEVAAMTAAFAAADPDARIAACPDWDVRGLANHVATLHRWVAAALEGPEMPPFEERPVEGDAAQIAATYAEAGAAMVQRMRELPADHLCWTFDKKNQTAGFWHRRQLHELAVHRWDIDHQPMSDDLSADGIDEALDFFLPRMLKAGRATLPDGSLELVSPERTWTLGSGEPAARMEGSASELLLALWGRARTLPSPWAEAKLMP